MTLSGLCGFPLGEGRTPAVLATIGFSALSSSCEQLAQALLPPHPLALVLLSLSEAFLVTNSGQTIQDHQKPAFADSQSNANPPTIVLRHILRPRANSPSHDTIITCLSAPTAMSLSCHIPWLLQSHSFHAYPTAYLALDPWT